MALLGEVYVYANLFVHLAVVRAVVARAHVTKLPWARHTGNDTTLDGWICSASPIVDHRRGSFVPGWYLRQAKILKPSLVRLISLDVLKPFDLVASHVNDSLLRHRLAIEALSYEGACVPTLARIENRGADLTAEFGLHVMWSDVVVDTDYVFSAWLLFWPLKIHGWRIWLDISVFLSSGSAVGIDDLEWARVL